jgi:hypothetical protein
MVKQNKLVHFIGMCVLMVIASCSTDAELPDRRPKPESRILYTQPDSIVNIRSMTGTTQPLDWNCGEDPAPKDSSVEFTIDLDLDGRDDIQFYTRHNRYIPSSYCGHCPLYYWSIGAISIHKDLIVTAVNFEKMKPYYAGEEIRVPTGIHNVSLRRSGGCYAFSSHDFGDSYMGFKLNDKVGWIQIKRAALNGITIVDYAIQQNPEAGIRAGQTI